MDDKQTAIKKKLIRWGNRLIDLLFYGVLAFMAWIVMQVFVLTSFKIPSDSMVPALLPGDAILVEKLTQGARLFNLFKSIAGKQVEIYRMPGLGELKRNDVVVFNYPYPKKGNRIEMDIMLYYVKRCVALPGDTFSIVAGRYRVNDGAQTLGNVEEQELFARYLRAQNLDRYDIHLRSFPRDSLIGWTMLDFGPYYIPAAGDSIPMNRRAMMLYRTLIEWEQGGKKLKWNNSSEQVCLNDSAITHYRFRKSYYFMAGDKASNSRDSRYWGLVPEEYIVGRVWRIWKSVDKETGAWRWGRIGKEVNE
jgi:signal peptidase I